jgi:hypothetical protein
MKPIKGIPEHTFVTIVGIAAFIHSTWTVATFSGGIAPAVNPANMGTIIVSVLAWLWWVIPGALAAFALEVGQVVTARQIQRGVGRKVRIWRFGSLNVKTITFVILSAATYLLQLTYLLHHFPDLPIASGLSASSQNAAKFVMEIVVWGMPLLLPFSMLMFTAGDESEISRSEAFVPLTVSCPDCEWSRSYDNDLAAQNALNGHKRTHSLLPLSSNGKH